MTELCELCANGWALAGSSLLATVAILAAARYRRLYRATRRRMIDDLLIEDNGGTIHLSRRASERGKPLDLTISK